jgi:regulator of sigma E protease
MSTMFLVVPGALLAITLLVVVHEAGHFLAAKVLRVGVLVFSLGFGNRLFGFTWRGTDYRVSSLPFGGYVRMSHADPFGEGGMLVDDEDLTPRARWFSNRPPWQRLAIMFAGPAANLVFPIALFTLLFVSGEPQARSIVGGVVPGTPAHEAGLAPMDEIVAVNGRPVATWDAAVMAMGELAGETRLGVRRGERRFEVAIPAAADPRGARGLGVESVAPDNEIGVDDPASPAGAAGLRTGDRLLAVDGAAVRDFNEIERAMLAAGRRVTLRWARGDAEAESTLEVDPLWPRALTLADSAVWQRWGIETATVFVKATREDSAALEAGVAAGDRLLRAGGSPVSRFGDVLRAVEAATEGDAPVREVDLVVRRGGEEHTFRLAPRVHEYVGPDGAYRRQPLIGIEGDGELVGAPEIPVHHPPVRAFLRAIDRTGRTVGLILERLGEMMTLEAPVLENLGGPVAMVSQATAAAERGLFYLGDLVAFFSISLAVLNLLPIPVLDGGAIFMYAAEWIRGRPLPRVLQERGLQVGVVFVGMLTLVVFAKDILQLTSLWMAEP